MRRTLRSLGEGGWKGFGEFRKDTSELCSEELHCQYNVRVKVGMSIRILASARKMSDRQSKEEKVASCVVDDAIT